jgi:hypothetical protein
MRAVSLESRLSTFSEYWQPRTVAQFNGNDVMVVKTKGGVRLAAGTPNTGDARTAAPRRVI